MCTSYRNHCSTICLLGQRSPHLRPLSLFIPLFSISAFTNALKQPNCYDFWPIVRATNVERVLSPPFEIQPADQGNKDEV